VVKNLARVKARLGSTEAASVETTEEKG
jgi:hypothetical protein